MSGRYPIHPSSARTIVNSLDSVARGKEKNRQGDIILSEFSCVLEFEFNSHKYSRQGKTEYGIEIVFRLDSSPKMEVGDIGSIQQQLENIVSSNVSDDIKIILERHGEKYVHIDEYVMSF